MSQLWHLLRGGNRFFRPTSRSREFLLCYLLLNQTLLWYHYGRRYDINRCMGAWGEGGCQWLKISMLSLSMQRFVDKHGKGIPLHLTIYLKIIVMGYLLVIMLCYTVVRKQYYGHARLHYHYWYIVYSASHSNRFNIQCKKMLRVKYSMSNIFYGLIDLTYNVRSLTVQQQQHY